MSIQAKTVAVIQAGSVPFDVAASIQKAADLTADAARLGARLVVFPEAFIAVYPKGVDFGARVGMRTADGREAYRNYFECAIDVPGPATAILSDIARDNRVTLVIGVIERAVGTLYCSVLFFSPAGDLVGKHRKLMPTAMERLIWGFGDGSMLPVVDTPLGRAGSIICWENYMPMLRMAMYAKGIQLYCASTVDDREMWPISMRHIASEGRCFVLSACQYIKRGAYPDSYPAIQGENPEVELIRGGSCIVDPLGEFIVPPVYGREVVLTAEVDVDLIAGGKYDCDVVGHYARPDIFQLRVDDRPQQAAVFTSDQLGDRGGRRSE